MPSRARTLLVALRPARLFGVLVTPALAGLSAWGGIVATIPADAIADGGGAVGVLLACLKFCYLCLAAVHFAMGLAATTGDPFDSDADDLDPPDTEAFWAEFPNGFDVAALAAGIAWVLVRLGS